MGRIKSVINYLPRCSYHLLYSPHIVVLKLWVFLPGDPNSEATIWQIKDDNYGLIEVKGKKTVKVFGKDLQLQDFRFFVLFHKNEVKRSKMSFNTSWYIRPNPEDRIIRKPFDQKNDRRTENTKKGIPKVLFRT